MEDKQYLEKFNTKLTEQDVIDIRSRYIPRKVTLQQLANEYGVNNSHIWHIVNGTHWKGV